MKPSSSLSLELRIINFQLMREKISSTSTRISTPLLCDDYKKIVEITLKFLGSELPAEKKFAWKKVRFMAWSLCSMKAFAFPSEMDCSKEIIKKLQKFQDTDEVIGEEALKTLECHLWYLSNLTIPMALFS